MEIEKIDVIIPTWNSMPEFEKCLKSLGVAFGNRLSEIIIVDRESTDGTIELAKEYGCKIITDTISLGSARLKGLQTADTKWIAFIDSDIELPKGWLNSMISYLSKYENVGWIFGRTLDDREKIRKMQLWEAKNKVGLYGGFKNGVNIVPYGKRGFTNNTICLCEPLLEAANTNIRKVSGHEDWVLTQVMHHQGYNVYEVPIFCDHMRQDVYGKWGQFTEAWNIYGQYKAGLNPNMFDYLWVPKKGLEFTPRFRDPLYLYHFSGRFIGVLKALWNPKEQQRRKP